MNICIIGKKDDKNSRYLYEEFKKKDFSKVFLTDLAKLNVRISNKRIGVYYKTELNWDVYVLRTGGEDHLGGKYLRRKSGGLAFL